jgi:hypothetical protein
MGVSPDFVNYPDPVLAEPVFVQGGLLPDCSFYRTRAAALISTHSVDCARPIKHLRDSGGTESNGNHGLNSIHIWPFTEPDLDSECSRKADPQSERPSFAYHQSRYIGRGLSRPVSANQVRIVESPSCRKTSDLRPSPHCR